MHKLTFIFYLVTVLNSFASQRVLRANLDLEMSVKVSRNDHGI